MPYYSEHSCKEAAVFSLADLANVVKSVLFDLCTVDMVSERAFLE